MQSPRPADRDAPTTTPPVPTPRWGRLSTRRHLQHVGSLLLVHFHIRLHPNNISRDSGIEIPEAWIPTIKKHSSWSTTKRTCEGTTSNSRNNNEDRNAPIATNQHATNSDTQTINPITRWRPAAPQSKRRDQQVKAIPSRDKRITFHLSYVLFITIYIS